MENLTPNSDIYLFEVSTDRGDGIELITIPKDWFQLSNMLKDFSLLDAKILPLNNCTAKHVKLITDIIEHIKVNMAGMYKVAVEGTLDVNTVKFTTLQIPAVVQASSRDRIIATNLADFLQIGIVKKFLLQYYALKILHSDDRGLTDIIDMLGSTPLTYKDVEEFGLVDDNQLWNHFPTARNMIFKGRRR